MSRDNTGLSIMWITMVTLLLLFTASIAGRFVYQADVFTATVTEISYHGRGGIFGGSEATVRFNDGRVYNLYEARVPSELREGYTYTLEYRTPYILGGSSLAIVESLD